jgi:hypothetical protein
MMKDKTDAGKQLNVLHQGDERQNVVLGPLKCPSSGW